MKKLLLAALVATTFTAQAHDVWVNAPTKQAENQTLKLEIGYGHFPLTEKISESRLSIFKPLQLINGKKEQIALTQQGENHQYVSSKPLEKGTYWAIATYQPTFWSRNAKNEWTRGNLMDAKDAISCEQSQMFAKGLISVGNDDSLSTMLTPVGLPLEIVPLADPNKAKAGEKFPVQILFEGKPLEGETVIATADTIIELDQEASAAEREPQGFSVKTDKEGKINLLPMVEGLWKIKVNHKTPFKDQKICKNSSYYATLVVPVGEKRAEHLEHHEHHHH